MNSRDKKIIKMYKNGVNSPEIGRRLDLTTARICQILKENKIETRPVYKFETDITALVAEYMSGKTTYELGAKHQISASVIGKVLKENGVKLRPSSVTSKIYYIDEHVYDEIDTEEKAYFLGLLLADGNSRKDCFSIRLALDCNDIELVQQFKDMFKYTKPLYTRSRKGFDTTMVTCEITNKNVSQKLYDWGIVPAKTFITKFPEKLEERFYRPFILGYFDGDGCITSNGHRSGFSMAGTEELLLRIQDILIKECELNLTKLIQSKNIKILSYGGNIQLQRIREYLYKDATIFLTRKKSKFDIIISLQPVAKEKAPTRPHWQPDLSYIIDQHEQGQSLNEIAKELGTYQTKLTRLLRSQGLEITDRSTSLKNKSNKHIPQILEWSSQGMSRRAISKQLGVARVVIDRIIRDASN